MTTPAGARLLDTASRLFYERGIRSVGVELIAEDAGTTKKTLYDRFGSKDALVVLYLRRRAALWQQRALAHLSQHPEPGPERILSVFDALGGWLDRQERGCAFVNAYAEVGGTDHPALPLIRAEKAWMRELFTALADEAGYDDSARLAPSCTCSTRARWWRSPRATSRTPWSTRATRRSGYSVAALTPSRARSSISWRRISGTPDCVPHVRQAAGLDVLAHHHRRDPQDAGGLADGDPVGPTVARMATPVVVDDGAAPRPHPV